MTGEIFCSQCCQENTAPRTLNLIYLCAPFSPKDAVYYAKINLNRVAENTHKNIIAVCKNQNTLHRMSNRPSLLQIIPLSFDLAKVCSSGVFLEENVRPHKLKKFD